MQLINKNTSHTHKFSHISKKKILLHNFVSPVWGDGHGGEGAVPVGGAAAGHAGEAGGAGAYCMQGIVYTLFHASGDEDKSDGTPGSPAPATVQYRGGFTSLAQTVYLTV